MSIADTSPPDRATQLRCHSRGLTDERLPALSAKRLGGKGREGLLLNAQELGVWSRACLSIQREICIATDPCDVSSNGRLAQDTSQELARLLLCTAPHILLHYERIASEDSFWGGKVGSDGRIVGQNHLGRIWMDLRTSKADGGAVPEPHDLSGDRRYTYVIDILSRLAAPEAETARSYLGFYAKSENAQQRDDAAEKMLGLLVEWGLDPRGPLRGPSAP